MGNTPTVSDGGGGGGDHGTLRHRGETVYHRSLTSPAWPRSPLSPSPATGPAEGTTAAAESKRARARVCAASPYQRTPVASGQVFAAVQQVAIGQPAAGWKTHGRAGGGPRRAALMRLSPPPGPSARLKCPPESGGYLSWSFLVVGQWSSSSQSASAYNTSFQSNNNTLHHSPCSHIRIF